MRGNGQRVKQHSSTGMPQNARAGIAEKENARLPGTALPTFRLTFLRQGRFAGALADQTVEESKNP